MAAESFPTNTATYYGNLVFSSLSLLGSLLSVASFIHLPSLQSYPFNIVMWMEICSLLRSIALVGPAIFVDALLRHGDSHPICRVMGFLESFGYWGGVFWNLMFACNVLYSLLSPGRLSPPFLINLMHTLTWPPTLIICIYLLTHHLFTPVPGYMCAIDLDAYSTGLKRFYVAVGVAVFLVTLIAVISVSIYVHRSHSYLPLSFRFKIVFRLTYFCFLFLLFHLWLLVWLGALESSTGSWLILVASRLNGFFTALFWCLSDTVAQAWAAKQEEQESDRDPLKVRRYSTDSFNDLQSNDLKSSINEIANSLVASEGVSSTSVLPISVANSDD